MISIFSFGTGIVTISGLISPEHPNDPALTRYLGDIRVTVDRCTRDQHSFISRDGNLPVYRCDFSFVNEGNQPVQITRMFESQAQDYRGNISHAPAIQIPDLNLKTLYPGEHLPVKMWYNEFPEIETVRLLRVSVNQDSVVFTNIPFRD